VYVSGRFTSIGGRHRDDIAAVDARTGKATTWNPGTDEPVAAFALSSRAVYAAGSLSGGLVATSVTS
jgi:hypothetical protein